MKGSGKPQRQSSLFRAAFQQRPLLFLKGKCDICRIEGPVAYISLLDRFYCRLCLELAAALIKGEYKNE